MQPGFSVAFGLVGIGYTFVYQLDEWFIFLFIFLSVCYKRSQRKVFLSCAPGGVGCDVYLAQLAGDFLYCFPLFLSVVIYTAGCYSIGLFFI